MADGRIALDDLDPEVYGPNILYAEQYEHAVIIVRSGHRDDWYQTLNITALVESETPGYMERAYDTNLSRRRGWKPEDQWGDWTGNIGGAGPTVSTDFLLHAGRVLTIAATLAAQMNAGAHLDEALDIVDEYWEF